MWNFHGFPFSRFLHYLHFRKASNVPGASEKNAKSDVSRLQCYQQAMIFFKINRINTKFLNCNLWQIFLFTTEDKSTAKLVPPGELPWHWMKQRGTKQSLCTCQLQICFLQYRIAKRLVYVLLNVYVNHKWESIIRNDQH